MCCKAVRLRACAKMFCNLVLASVSALKRFIWLRLDVVGARKESSVPNTSNDCTKPFHPMVSFIAFMEMRHFELLSRFWCLCLITLKVILR